MATSARTHSNNTARLIVASLCKFWHAKPEAAITCGRFAGLHFSSTFRGQVTPPCTLGLGQIDFRESAADFGTKDLLRAGHLLVGSRARALFRACVERSVTMSRGS